MSLGHKQDKGYLNQVGGGVKTNSPGEKVRGAAG